MSEAEACSLASSFFSEIICIPESADIPSRAFLADAARLKETKHENGLTTLFWKYGLMADIPMKHIDVGTPQQHPVLTPADVVSTLSRRQKLSLLFCNHDGGDYEEFWEQWRPHQSDHPVYKEHKHRLHACIPIWIFADEGTSQKRKALMVMQFQPILGMGSRRSQDVNLSGVSTTSRFLYPVMSGKVYAGKHKKQQPLHELVKQFALDVGQCFSQGIPVQNVPWAQRIFLVCLSLKGDLQGIVKLGKLSRSFLRDTATSTGSGVCHLCKAGQPDFPWHETAFTKMSDMKKNVADPWQEEPSLVKHIPQSPSRKHEFFRLDPFHILVKGVYADLAANAVVSITG